MNGNASFKKSITLSYVAVGLNLLILLFSFLYFTPHSTFAKFYVEISSLEYVEGINKDEFASHGDFLVKVNSTDGLEIGDILAPDENGYGRKATEDELIFMMMYAIPRPKITALNVEGYEGFVACFIV